jgi:hypothetical protein
LGIFARLKGDREFWTRTRWRRERNWIPTFSRRIVNAFAALRAIHLKAQNGSANAAPIIRESPSTRDSRGFEDPLATAELSNAFLAAKALQHDADLALRRRMPPRRAADVLHKLFRRLLRQPRAYRSFQGRKRTCGRRRLWRSQNSDQRCRHGARKRRTRCCLPPSAGRNGMPSLMKSAPRRIFCGFARI